MRLIKKQKGFNVKQAAKHRGKVIKLKKRLMNNVYKPKSINDFIRKSAGRVSVNDFLKSQELNNMYDRSELNKIAKIDSNDLKASGKHAETAKNKSSLWKYIGMGLGGLGLGLGAYYYGDKIKNWFSGSNGHVVETLPNKGYNENQKKLAARIKKIIFPLKK